MWQNQLFSLPTAPGAPLCAQSLGGERWPEKLLHKLPSLFEREVLKIPKERPSRRSGVRFGSPGRPREVGIFGILSVQLDGPCGPLERVPQRCRKGIFPGLYSTVPKEGEGWGNKGGSERTSTETLPCSQHGHDTAGATSARRARTPWGDRGAFPARSSGALPAHAAPAFHLPFSDPSTVPAPQRAPWGAGHTPQSPSFLPGARKAPGTTRSWGSGRCSIACPEQGQHPNLGLFRVKGL